MPTMPLHYTPPPQPPHPPCTPTQPTYLPRTLHLPSPQPTHTMPHMPRPVLDLATTQAPPCPLHTRRNA
eukprot:4842723-Alexandrium_andersonii.AAC.1